MSTLGKVNKNHNKLLMRSKNLTFGCLLAIVSLLLLCSCSTNEAESTPSTAKDPIVEARESVVEKWENEADILGTGRFIEDIYKQYPDDDVISNIYFYSIAKEQYEYYESFNDTDYLTTAIEYAAKIDPEYDGAFSEDMQSFASELLVEEDREKVHEEAKSSTDYYNSLTNSDKKEICEYIQSRYDYYDSINGGYAGDKYTDTIWGEVATKYGLTESQIDIIWMNSYSY